MKKFVLRYNRCTVVTGFFKCKLCPYIKGRYPWNEADEQKKIFFCLNQLRGYP